MSVATGTGYERRVLHSVDAFEIVECHWEYGGFSPMHDHGWSRCAVLVQEGRFENTLDCGASVETVTYGVGETIVTPVGARHEARCVSEGGGRTLHVYTPRVEKSESPRFRSPSLEEVSRAVDLRLGPESLPWADVETLMARVRENSVSTHSPLFMNQLFAGVTPHALAAAEAETLTKTTLATFEASPVLTSIELELVDRLGELAGWSPGARGGVGVPGGSSANFMAIHCARHFHDPESKAHGNRDVRYRIFVSREAHYSFRKACAVLGLGTAAVIPVDVDARGRLSVQALARAIDESTARGETPLLACATAGTTVLGAFDPIDEIVDVCVDRKVWTHVDGAWGGPALFSERTRSSMTGVDRADSIAIDAHKLLGAPLTSSFFLTRHREILQGANDVSGGDYLFHSDSVVQDRGRLSWQCGRGSSALGLWALWKNLGTSGIGNFVDELIELRHDVVSWVRTQPRLHLIHEPEWLNVCVRVVPHEGEGDKANWSRRVRESLRDEDVAFVNFSSDDGGSFLRLILAHPRLSLACVQGILEAAQAVRA